MGFFNYERKRWATEDVATCYECAQKAGCEQHLFINFGGLLGIVRENDWIGWDNDIDMSMHADMMTREQQDAYIQNLEDAGMFFARKRICRRNDTGAATWFSLRRKSKRAKFCHWCGFSWEGFWWWSKAGKWVTQSKFNYDQWGVTDETEGIMLGIPEGYVKELMWIEFRGIKVQIPKMYGSVLDWEYPAWPIPKKGGSSKKQVVCVVPKWADERTWRVKMA